MVQRAVKSNIGDSGVADVRVGKNTVKVQFEESGIVYDLTKEGWKEERGSGKYIATLTKDNKKILSLKPVQGTYIFEFDSFGNRINEIPEPAVQPGGPRQSKDGSKRWFAPDSLVWRVNLKVVSEGLYEGLTVMYQLPYIFAAVPGTPNTQLLGNSRKQLEQVEEFFRAVGFDLVNREIPFSINVLPWLEKTLQQVNTPFLAKINEKGFMSDLSVLPPELNPMNKPAKKGKK